MFKKKASKKANSDNFGSYTEIKVIKNYSYNQWHEAFS